MFKRPLLALELFILCAPATTLLCIGVIYLPAMLTGLIALRGDWPIAALMVICGLWGLISLSNLAFSILNNNTWPGRPIQWFGITLGVIACLIGLLTATENAVMLFVFIGPVLAAAHLLYLSRKPVQTS